MGVLNGELKRGCSDNLLREVSWLERRGAERGLCGSLRPAAWIRALMEDPHHATRTCPLYQRSKVRNRQRVNVSMTLKRALEHRGSLCEELPFCGPQLLSPELIWVPLRPWSGCWDSWPLSSLLLWTSVWGRPWRSGCRAVPQFPWLADADGETWAPATKCSETKRRRSPELCTASVRAVINSAPDVWRG